jgi:hypothetical protein
MSRINRSLWRAAAQVHEILQRPSNVRKSVPIAQWQRCQQLAASLETAGLRSWQLAARYRRVELVVAVADLEQSLLRWSDQLRMEAPQNRAASVAELYRDFIALKEDFPEFEYDPDLHLLAVTTEPVVLEGIELGRFQIRLDYQHLYDVQPYSVVALDPNPAASNSSITHPHVTDDTVCEGDGRRAIQAAVSQGRLLDFFTLVSQLLHTYAPGRAYVELEIWSGTACRDCGSLMEEDDQFHCSRCEEGVCGDCGTVCSVCDQFYCNGCSNSCQRCDSATCVSCLEECRSCRQRVCSECLTQNLCEQCHEEQIESDQESTDECSPLETADAPVQPDSLGQTITSA